MNRRICLFAALLVAAPAAAADPVPTGTLPAPPVEVAVPTDGEIVHALVTANDLDLEYARLAKRRARDLEVLAYAERMITEHEALTTQLRDAAGRAQVILAEGEASRAMKREQEAAKKALEALEGRAFEEAYLDREIREYTAMLDRIDRMLLPDVKAPELKAAIGDARAVFAAHLDQAKRLREKLTAPPTPASIAP